jgi:histidinol-phosphate aminotransferase
MEQCMMTATTLSAADSVRDAIRLLSAYTLEKREASDKLDQNESPFDWPQSFKEEVMRRVAQRPWNLYPDFELTRLREKLAARYGLSIDEVLVGNGSNELLLAALTTFVSPGRRVIIPSPSFALYEKIARVLGGDVRLVALEPERGTLPVDVMLREIAACDEPPLIVVCSPNNPTGGVLQNGELERLLESGATVLFDRAYGEFALDRYPSLHSRLITLSTFSKAWGLAGLRLGWLSSTAENVREIRKVKLPYNLNFVSEEAAIVALDHEEMKDRNVAMVVAERERVRLGLLALGVEVYPSEANFVTFRVGETRRPEARGPAAPALHCALLERGVLIRDVSGYARLDGCLRVSIGTPEQNDRFLEVISEVMG